MADIRNIATTTHGRYLVDAADPPSRRVLAGFHGYAEQAALHLERLRAMRGSAAGWNLVSIQALHRFYRTTGSDQLAASWMTREDRDLLIADNVGYVDGVIDAVATAGGAPSALVFAGYSQGASMAYRAAALCRAAADGVIVVGGDVPPELTAAQLARVGRVLIGWGVRDTFFTEAKKTEDVRRLAAAGADVTVVELDAGHRWTDDFTAAAAAWLRRWP